MTQNHTYLATCNAAFTSLLCRELEAYTGTPCKTVPSGVEFSCDKTMAMKLCMFSVYADEIYIYLNRINLGHQESLDTAVKFFRLQSCFDNTKSISVGVVSEDNTEKWRTKTASTFARAIVSYFDDLGMTGLKVKQNDADLHIRAIFQDNTLRVAIRVSGDPAWTFKGRRDTAAFEMSESMAAGIVTILGCTGETNFIDPSCTSPSLLMAAATLAASYPPGLSRKSFGFEHLEGFSIQDYERLHKIASNLATENINEAKARKLVIRGCAESKSDADELNSFFADHRLRDIISIEQAPMSRLTFPSLENHRHTIVASIFADNTDETGAQANKRQYAELALALTGQYGSCVAGMVLPSERAFNNIALMGALNCYIAVSYDLSTESRFCRLTVLEPPPGAAAGHANADNDADGATATDTWDQEAGDGVSHANDDFTAPAANDSNSAVQISSAQVAKALETTASAAAVVAAAAAAQNSALSGMDTEGAMSAQEAHDPQLVLGDDVLESIADELHSDRANAREIISAITTLVNDLKNFQDFERGSLNAIAQMLNAGAVHSKETDQALFKTEAENEALSPLAPQLNPGLTVMTEQNVQTDASLPGLSDKDMAHELVYYVRHDWDWAAAGKSEAADRDASADKAWKKDFASLSMCQEFWVEPEAGAGNSTAPVSGASDLLALPVSDALQKYGFISPARARILSALLNAAAIMAMPVMLTGPGTGRIINTFCSASGFDRLSTITLGHQWDGSEFKTALNECSEVVRVDNVFSPGYSDSMLTVAAESQRIVFIDYPFCDDLALHPRGLFNFVLPVIADMYVNTPFLRDCTMHRAPSCPLKKLEKVTVSGQPLKLPEYFSKLGLYASTLSNLELFVGIATELYRKLLPDNISREQAGFNIMTAGALAPLAHCTDNIHLLEPAYSSSLLFPAVKQMTDQLLRTHGIFPDDGTAQSDPASLPDPAAAPASHSSAAMQDPSVASVPQSRNIPQELRDRLRAFKPGQVQSARNTDSSMSRLLDRVNSRRGS